MPEGFREPTREPFLIDPDSERDYVQYIPVKYANDHGLAGINLP